MDNTNIITKRKAGRPYGTTKNLTPEKTAKLLESIILSKRHTDIHEKIDCIKLLAAIKGWTKRATLEAELEIKNEQKTNDTPKNDELRVTFNKGVEQATNTTTTLPTITTTSTTTVLHRTLEFEL